MHNRDRKNDRANIASSWSLIATQLPEQQKKWEENQKQFEHAIEQHVANEVFMKTKDAQQNNHSSMEDEMLLDVENTSYARPTPLSRREQWEKAKLLVDQIEESTRIISLFNSIDPNKFNRIDPSKFEALKIENSQKASDEKIESMIDKSFTEGCNAVILSKSCEEDNNNPEEFISPDVFSEFYSPF